MSPDQSLPAEESSPTQESFNVEDVWGSLSAPEHVESAEIQELQHSVSTTGRLTKEGLDVLREMVGEALVDADWHKLEYAVRTIGKFGESAEALSPYLVSLLKTSQNSFLKGVIIDTIVDVAPNDIIAVVALRSELIGSPDDHVRLRAAVALGEIGGLESMRALEVAAESDYEGSDRVREAATEALDKIFQATSDWGI